MSDAVGNENVSRTTGYKVDKGNFNEVTPNLPRYIAIMAEANTANQGTLSLTPTAITSAAQAGQLYGFGSPIYIIMRILRSIFGGGIGGIPTVVYPQAQAGGATYKKISVSPMGVATGTGVHTLIINGRRNMDGQPYDYTVNTGDTADDITAKQADVINAILGCPVTATFTPYEMDATTKWKGLTAEEVNISIDTNGNDLGITYAINVITHGSGTPDVTPALALIGNVWATEIINSYGLNLSTLTAFEEWNGIPDPDNPTGRFAAMTFKPAVVISGSISDDPSAITDARLNDVTIAVAPAPNSLGLSMEAAANACLLFSRKAQDTPHLDIGGSLYPDMPTPIDIGSMSDYVNRNTIMQKGCSTVSLSNGAYKVEDFVTTYHPIGEVPPAYRYVRDLYSVDANVFFGYYLLENSYVIDHVIANDDDIVTAPNVIKPKQWKAEIFNYADDLAQRALITVPSFMQAGIDVELSTSNPNRINTTFPYKRSGVARIVSTTVTAGFNFGTF